MLLEALKVKALELNLMQAEDEIDLARAFTLVRDMPYARASSREPETIIDEWRGTCSGKHYLLKALFAELGSSSRLIACTTTPQLDPADYPGRLRELLEESNGSFVDVHNYLILELPEGEMIVDATWPLSTQEMGTVVNEEFVPGVDQRIVVEVDEAWEIPEDRDPQAFKDEILHSHFSQEELTHREAFIEAVSALIMGAG